MIETYSRGVDVNSGSEIPLNSVSVLKGCSVEKQGASSLIFNKCGIYEVRCTVNATADGSGDITVELSVNGQVKPNASATETAADTTSVHNMAFSTLVQVPFNNSPCKCVTPTVISFVNSGVGATIDINVEVTRV